MCGNIKVLASLRCECAVQWANAYFECLVSGRAIMAWNPYMHMHSIHQLPMPA